MAGPGGGGGAGVEILYSFYSSNGLYGFFLFWVDGDFFQLFVYSRLSVLCLCNIEIAMKLSHPSGSLHSFSCCLFYTKSF